MDNSIDGTDGKLGHGFTSAIELEEIDIGSRDKPRPTYISARLDPKYKQELVDLLKEFKDCFAWEYYEMPGLAIADPVYWELEDFECFSGKLWKGCFIKISSESQQPIQAVSFESLF